MADVRNALDRPMEARDASPWYAAAALVAAVVPERPACIVGDAAWAAVQAAAALLPAALGRAFYFESRLGVSDAAVDWIVRLDRTGRDIVAGLNPRLTLPLVLRSDEVWARIARFCAAWAEDPALDHVVHHAWLEFDLAHRPRPVGDSAALPSPSLFVGLDQAVEANWSTAALWGVIDRLLGLVAPGCAPGARGALRAALTRRPPGATVPYVGFMLGRPQAAVRLYVARVDTNALPMQMRRMGWPGDATTLLARLQHTTGGGAVASSGTPRIAMAHLDVTADVEPRIGVEYLLRRGPQSCAPRGVLADVAFLDRLVEVGLCTGAKRRALAVWPGRTQMRLPHELWTSTVRQRVNHVKVGYEVDRAVQAKAYLLTRWEPAGARPSHHVPDGRTEGTRRSTRAGPGTACESPL